MAQTPVSFRELHHGARPLIVPNPWDVGSAVILERLGFLALATTSCGMAFSLGLTDGSVPPATVLEHCRSLVEATSIPISGDLERGFGDTPEEVAETIKQAAAVGLAGCSIEDHTGNPDDPIYEKTLAIERVAAAVEAARDLEQDFVVTARCENILWTDRGLDETIAMLLAYEEVGADVLFAPALKTVSEIRLVCDAISAPVSVGMDMPNKPHLDEIAEIGVARVSVGGLFTQLAYGAMITSARELIERGTLNSANGAMDYGELEGLFVSDS